jgi:hypothetical protein
MSTTNGLISGLSIIVYTSNLTAAAVGWWAPAVRALALTESQCQAVGLIAGGAAKHDPLRVKC